MPNVRAPRKGSMQHWPRKRAKREYAHVRSWAVSKDVKPLGFAGYKVGMAHIMFTQQRANSPNKGRPAVAPVTIIECPPLKVMALAYYSNTIHGVKKIAEVRADTLDKVLLRRLRPTKTKKAQTPADFDDVRLVVHTQPGLTGIGKKKPEVFEVCLGGKKDERAQKATELLGKEVGVQDVISVGNQVDMHAVTKGKGYQGPVKRFGVSLRRHKSEKGTRGPASLGSWTANRSWAVAHAGQMGYHLRTEYNKLVIDVAGDASKLNPNGGFMHYGVVKNPYVIVHGSVGGSKKRLIRFNSAIRPNPKLKETPKMEALIQ